MSRITLLSAALLSIAQVAFADNYFDHNGNINLRFNAGGRFKIMQLTDLHFGESVDGDDRTIEEIK